MLGKGVGTFLATGGDEDDETDDDDDDDDDGVDDDDDGVDALAGTGGSVREKLPVDGPGVPIVQGLNQLATPNFSDAPRRGPRSSELGSCIQPPGRPT